MDADAFFVEEGYLDAARDLVSTVEHADLLLYTGDRHLFADPSLPTYDDAAATLLIERVVSFLDVIA
jgi:dienelactone hydrolase